MISANQRLSLNADFLYYFNSNPVQLNSEYFDKKNEYVFSSQFRSNKRTPVRFWILSGNYFGKSGTPKINMRSTGSEDEQARIKL